MKTSVRNNQATALPANSEPVAQKLVALFGGETLIEGVLSGPRQQTADSPRRVIVTPFVRKGERVYQFAYHAARKVTHRNLPPDEASTHLLALLTETFRQAQFFTTEEDVQIQLNKRREITLTTRPPSRTQISLQHDRSKQYLLAEGTAIDFLVQLGVMRADGKVIAAKYDKFRQINRFLEMVEDVADTLDSSKTLQIVDFGCGKAYLTFALAHYLRMNKKWDARVIGVDIRPDIITQNTQIAGDLGYTGLSFAVGDIRSYAEVDRADMVVALHACDTATDDALVKAVAWGAQIILAAPCCQHELFRQVQNEVMQPLLKHGILRERLSALVTDAARANLLETAGYAVQMLEFIAPEHTPKNLLIRAVRQQPNPRREAQAAETWRAFREFWQIHPTLERELARLENTRADTLPDTPGDGPHE